MEEPADDVPEEVDGASADEDEGPEELEPEPPMPELDGQDELDEAEEPEDTEGEPDEEPEPEQDDEPEPEDVPDTLPLDDELGLPVPDVPPAPAIFADTLPGTWEAVHARMEAMRPWVRWEIAQLDPGGLTADERAELAEMLAERKAERLARGY